MFSWINKLIDKTFNEDITVLDAQYAKFEVDKHNKSFTKEQDKYRDSLCYQIIKEARSGKRLVYTYTVGDKKFMTNDYLEELKIFFENRGFEAVKVYDDTFYGYYLQIMW